MNNSTPMFTSASKHCHCHCTCHCVACNNACNSCSVLHSDPSWGQMSAENLRLNMYNVQNETKITQDLASKIMQNLRVVTAMRQQKAPTKDSHTMVGPHPHPATSVPIIGDVITNRTNSSAWVKYIVEQVQLKYTHVVKDHGAPAIGTLADKDVNITNQFWEWLNNHINIMRVYSNYFNYAVCTRCDTTCGSCHKGSCTTCTPACTAGTTASQNEVYTVNPVCNVPGAL